MGARAHSRGGAAPARRASGEDASAAGDGRASLRHDQGPDGSNTLPDEDPATGGYRDGIARPGLQSHARHEHHGHPAAHGGDEGIVIANLRPSPGAERPRSLESAQGDLPDGKIAKVTKMTARGHLPRSRCGYASARAFLHNQDPNRNSATRSLDHLVSAGEER